jgi:hypothetical protein
MVAADGLDPGVIWVVERLFDGAAFKILRARGIELVI